MANGDDNDAMMRPPQRTPTDHCLPPCPHCARIVHDGTGRVSVSLTATEAIALALGEPDRRLLERLLTAAALLDPAAVDEAVDEARNQGGEGE